MAQPSSSSWLSPVESKTSFGPGAPLPSTCCEEIDRVLAVGRQALAALHESERWEDLERFTAAYDDALELLDWAQTLGEPRAAEAEALIDAMWAELEAYLEEDEALSKMWLHGIYTH